MTGKGALSLNTATVRDAWTLEQCIDGCQRHGITGISPWRVLQANLMFPEAVRPAWIVFFVTAGLTAASVIALWLRPVRSAREKLKAAE